MDNNEFEAWVISQRQTVEKYLSREGIEEPNVGPWPAFEVAPYFAIWAVESKKSKGKIGWWAFSGDCPTDCVAEDGTCHPRQALKRLLHKWRGYIPNMKAGRQPPDVTFGEQADLKLLADLLEKRVSILEKWWLDDELWENR